MTLSTVLPLLLISALLEVGGDAIVRHGLRAPAGSARLALFAVGAGVLFAYGYLVNAAPWDFGRLLGVYIVFFFVVAQAVSWLAFGQPPSRAVIVGGALVVAGGAVIAMGGR